MAEYKFTPPPVASAPAPVRVKVEATTTAPIPNLGNTNTGDIEVQTLDDDIEIQIMDDMSCILSDEDDGDKDKDKDKSEGRSPALAKDSKTVEQLWGRIRLLEAQIAPALGHGLMGQTQPQPQPLLQEVLDKCNTLEQRLDGFQKEVEERLVKISTELGTRPNQDSHRHGGSSNASVSSPAPSLSSRSQPNKNPGGQSDFDSVVEHALPQPEVRKSGRILVINPKYAPTPTPTVAMSMVPRTDNDQKSVLAVSVGDRNKRKGKRDRTSNTSKPGTGTRKVETPTPTSSGSSSGTINTLIKKEVGVDTEVEVTETTENSAARLPKVKRKRLRDTPKKTSGIGIIATSKTETGRLSSTICLKCGKNFFKPWNLRRHQMSCCAPLGSQARDGMKTAAARPPSITANTTGVKRSKLSSTKTKTNKPNGRNEVRVHVRARSKSKPKPHNSRNSSSKSKSAVRHLAQQHGFTSCPDCRKPILKKRLKRHMMIHTDERPFGCPHCPRRFRDRRTAMEHTFIHTGKPHACDHDDCDRRYTTARKLKLHKERFGHE